MSEALQKYILMIPESNLGEVVGELNHRGAYLDRMGDAEEVFTVEARAPENRMVDFESWLLDVTNGQGKFVKLD